MDLANNLISQLEYVDEASDEDIAKYNKILITIKSKLYQLRACMTSADKSPEDVKKYATTIIIVGILKKTVWQTVGSSLSDKQGLDMAYSSRLNLYYDGNTIIYIYIYTYR
jgi:hypothetical protein